MENPKGKHFVVTYFGSQTWQDLCWQYPKSNTHLEIEHNAVL